MDTIFDFIGGSHGEWEVRSIKTICGNSLQPISHLRIIQSTLEKENSGVWTLKGLRSHLRYTEKHEKEKLSAIQADLGRSEAVYAALIPIRKNSAWWNLAQDERRIIFENQSHHTEIGLQYLPAIARRLYHCRDIKEPFDFLTWFEYAPEHEAEFEDLLFKLRASEEWNFVDREIDIRLKKQL